MAEIDINQITNAVVAELRNGATDMAGITPSTALNDSDNVLAQEGSTLKKLPVSLFKQIVAAGATVYRLTADSVVFKATTTAVAIGVTKSEGGEVTVLSTLPTGWKIGVHCESGDAYQDTYYSAPMSIDPHAWESVAVTLYDGDPQSSSSAQAVDIVTLRLVSDGEKGDKGDTGEQGPQGEKGEKGEDGATAGSLILQPYNDYECYNVTALDYETGIVTVDSEPTDIEVGDYVAVVYYNKDNAAWQAPLTQTWNADGAHKNNGAYYYGYVTAKSGNTLTVNNYLIEGKGVLSNPTNFMLVHYGASEPTDDLSITLPDAYKGKPIKVDLVGQGIMKQSGWNNWRVDITIDGLWGWSGSLDGGRGGVICTTTEFSEHMWREWDWAYEMGIDTGGSYRHKLIVAAVPDAYDITKATAIVVPWQFRVPFNEIRISIL